jgi:hypothetical protein
MLCRAAVLCGVVAIGDCPYSMPYTLLVALHAQVFVCSLLSAIYYRVSVAEGLPVLDLQGLMPGDQTVMRLDNPLLVDLPHESAAV